MIEELSLKQLACRTFAFILLVSCRRISDLSLLIVDEPCHVLSENAVVFQVDLGLKQARPGHQYPVIELDAAPDEALCPVRHVEA